MNLDTFERLLEKLPGPDEEAAAAARERNASLTKPAGALGRLEDLAEWCSAWQGRHPPALETVQITVFAGNHDVVRHGVSAYPATVTGQMAANFRAGGAAINQLATTVKADLKVVELNLEQPVADFTREAAMTVAELEEALTAGFESVPPEADMFVAGEMGIGNTTAASALACILFGGEPAAWVGPGTGLDASGIAAKTRVVAAGLALHVDETDHPMEALRRLGGREIAAITGAILAARLNRVPVILDGFVVTTAAAVLERLQGGALDHCVAGHVSREPGHRKLLEAIRLKPLLELDMNLGEASGGALALGLLRGAVATHNGMSTFEAASVDRQKQ